MNKLINYKSILLLGITVLSAYIWAEFKKHGFTNMSNMETVSVIVVLSTFLIIGLLSFITSKRNELLYQRLQKEIQQLNENENENNIYLEIKNSYKQLIQSDYSNVNIPAFLESFMANNQFTKKRSIPKELKLLQANASTPILIGVLGTFVGLVMALSQLQIGDMDEAVNLQPILNGVGTAFYTSICGVLSSILLNVHLRHYNSDQLFMQYMLQLENMLYKLGKNSSDEKLVDTLIDVREEIKKMGHSFSEVSKFSEEFKSASINLQSFNKDFSSNIQDMKSIFESTKDVMQLFNSRTAQFHEDFERLFDYFKNNEEHQELMITRQAETNQELKAAFEANKGFQESATNQLEQLQQTFVGNFEKQEEYYTISSTLLDKTAAVIEQQMEGVSLSQKELLEVQQTLHVAVEQQVNQIEKVATEMNSILQTSNFDNLTEASIAFSKSTEDVHHVIQQFVQTYKEIQQTSNEHYESLATITNKLDHLMTTQHTTSESQSKELQKTVQLITTYQENLQQAVIRFLNNDFDYDKLRKILDEVKENMEIQNQFLIQQLNNQQQPKTYETFNTFQQPMNSNEHVNR